MIGHGFFYQNLLCLTTFDGKLALNQIEFTKDPIRVQMHDVPLGMMNSFYREELGKSIDEVIELDVDNDSIELGLYLRVKV